MSDLAGSSLLTVGSGLGPALSMDDDDLEVDDDDGLDLEAEIEREEREAKEAHTAAGGVGGVKGFLRSSSSKAEGRGGNGVGNGNGSKGASSGELKFYVSTGLGGGGSGHKKSKSMGQIQSNRLKLAGAAQLDGMMRTNSETISQMNERLYSQDMQVAEQAEGMKSLAIDENLTIANEEPSATSASTATATSTPALTLPVAVGEGMGMGLGVGGSRTRVRPKKLKVIEGLQFLPEQYTHSEISFNWLKYMAESDTEEGWQFVVVSYCLNPKENHVYKFVLKLE